MKKLVSVVSGCYNEEGNVEELYRRVAAAFELLPEVDWELIFIDNGSTDGTVDAVKALARDDHRLKMIVNVRNFGHIRSHFHGLVQAHGDAVILMSSDLQDPPEMVVDFVRKWQEGYKVVLGVKTESEETPLLFLLRTAYYDLLNTMSAVTLTRNNTGFGLYDRVVMDVLRDIKDPYPYYRGMVAELGFESAKIPFKQPRRVRGITKNNFYTLYDMAMLGITNHSKVPLRLATLLGFVVALISILVGTGYFVAKMVLWNNFNAGQAPTVIGLFFLGAVQLIFMGILGEYIGAIHTQVMNRPRVIEKERVNFEAPRRLSDVEARS